MPPVVAAGVFLSFGGAAFGVSGVGGGREGGGGDLLFVQAG